jgi:hypothetical protein
MKEAGAVEAKTCTVCGNPTHELLRLDGGFKLRLRESGAPEPIPDQACAACFNKYSELISQGAQLRAKENAKQQQRMSMWRNRMNLIKQARTKMEAKNFAEAAVLYEKYIRILEIIYEIEVGTLSPDLFRNKARGKEMTLITSVYWDLARIYDSAGQYRERLEKTISKIIQFAPQSGILVQLSTNVLNYSKYAKNPEQFKRLEREFGIKKGMCFIATAVFDSEFAPEVIALQNFRDERLLPHKAGRAFIRIYYRVSPHFVPAIQRSRFLKNNIAYLLRKLASRL